MRIASAVGVRNRSTDSPPTSNPEEAFKPRSCSEMEVLSRQELMCLIQSQYATP
jgi:hypothetical protein